MENWFHYLSEDLNDDDWGNYFPTFGYQQILPGNSYPLSGHPDTHKFDWKKGRVLKDHYIIYIPTGRGELETKSNHWEVNAGDVIVLAPHDWHRYKPCKETGWEEYWVGFSGELFSNKILKDLLPSGTSYIKHIGFQDELIFLFNKLMSLTKNHIPGLKKILSGIVMQIVANLVCYETFDSESREERITKQTISYIKKYLTVEIDFKKLASEHQLSYNRFRTIFKNETGVSLQQFLIQERLENGKRLLINTDLSMKEISANTGFSSLFYFSKLFKEKMGYSPRQIRSKKIPLTNPRSEPNDI